MSGNESISDEEDSAMKDAVEEGVLEQDYILHEDVRTPWDMIKYSI